MPMERDVSVRTLPFVRVLTDGVVFAQAAAFPLTKCDNYCGDRQCR